MDTHSITEALNREIDRLKQARAILETLPNSGAAKRGPGRYPSAKTSVPERRKRVMSDEARAKIAAAQKKRWAAKQKGQ